MALRLKYENFELLHIITIAHAISCFVISGFVYLILRGNTYMIDRRQYFSMLGLTSILTLAYFLSLIYVVYRAATSQTKPRDLFDIFESLLDLLASLSNNTLSFIFAVMMNFVILGGIYCLNVCSVYLVELARAVE
jgi:hypothetical protein